MRGIVAWCAAGLVCAVCSLAEAAKGYLGARVLDSAVVKEQMKGSGVAFPAEGVMLVGVEPAGAAAEAGLRDYDVIVRIGTRPMRTSADLAEAGLEVGKKIRIDYRRNEMLNAAKPAKQGVWRSRSVEVTPTAALKLPAERILRDSAPESLKAFWPKYLEARGKILTEKRQAALCTEGPEREKLIHEYYEVRNRGDHCPLISFTALNVGEVGSFTDLRVVQILDEQSMLAQPGDLLRQLDKKSEFNTVWITGIPTSGLADDDRLSTMRLGGYFEVVGNRRYTTVNGSSRTVMQLRFFRIADYVIDKPAQGQSDGTGSAGGDQVEEPARP